MPPPQKKVMTIKNWNFLDFPKFFEYFWGTFYLQYYLLNEKTYPLRRVFFLFFYQKTLGRKNYSSFQKIRFIKYS